LGRPIIGGTERDEDRTHSRKRQAGRKIRIEATRTFESADCIYDLAPGDDGRWYLIGEMIDPPMWIMSWPSLETARRFLDQMSAEDCEQMQGVILEVIEKTGELIATDFGEFNTVGGFYGTWIRLRSEHSPVVGCSSSHCERRSIEPVQLVDAPFSRAQRENSRATSKPVRKCIIVRPSERCGAGLEPCPWPGREDRVSLAPSSGLQATEQNFGGA
jgi:hypothetical protein